jgi:hypothetical protein
MPPPGVSHQGPRGLVSLVVSGCPLRVQSLGAGRSRPLGRVKRTSFLGTFGVLCTPLETHADQGFLGLTDLTVTGEG